MPEGALVDHVFEALALPLSASVNRRIPKAVLSEHGASTAKQRKQIDNTVERLDWRGTLSPITAGIAAATDEERSVTEIQLLALAARAEPTQELLLIIHRAIPYPVLLLSTLASGAVRISLAPLRRAERLHEGMVVERLIVAPDLAVPLDTTALAFLTSLYLGKLPQTNLGSLYDGLVQRVEAFIAARLSGADFRLPQDAAEASRRREGLALYSQLLSEWTAARAAARREKRLAQQVALAEQARTIERDLKVLTATLA